MRLPRFRSLEGRLVVRLALVYLAVTVLAAGLLAFRAFDSASALNQRELRLRALDLARAVSVDSGGEARLALPANLASAYATSASGDTFAIRALDGRIIASSSDAFSERVATLPVGSSEPSWFRLDDVGIRSGEYYGLNVVVPTAAGSLAVTVAQRNGSHALVESLMADFLFETAWIFPLLFVVTLAMAAWAIRAGLKPIRQASEHAAVIGPDAISERLPEASLPSEVAPLVSAVNRALDRLERGFVAQRQFIDNAAHELRTPLAIVSAAIEAMPDNEEVASLRADVARMSHLVDRLLSVARLDALRLDTSGTAELNVIASSVVEAMAPWVIAQERSIALRAADAPASVRGASHAIEDALRNLIENAVAHAARNGEVVVSVNKTGELSVADNGPGVSGEERARIFDRFYRGKNAKAGGAGLGLSIVSEIMKAHGGGVAVSDNPGGGAVFTLTFPQAVT